jgi:hypothetical protein
MQAGFMIVNSRHSLFATESEGERRIPATLSHRNRAITAAGLQTLKRSLAQIEAEISGFE